MSTTQDALDALDRIEADAETYTGKQYAADRRIIRAALTRPPLPVDLAAIQARADAATAGPWEPALAPAAGSSETHAEYLAGTLIGEGEPLHVLTAASPIEKYAYLVPAVTGDGPTSRANAEFIAAAREDVPALVAELAELRIMVEGTGS